MARLKPDTLAMTAALAMLTALGPLSTDFYLPSVPDIATVFSTTTAGAQATLSAFLFGHASGQVFYGRSRTASGASRCCSSASACSPPRRWPAPSRCRSRC